MRRLLIVGMALAVTHAGCGNNVTATATGREVTTGSCCTHAGSCFVTTQSACAGNWTESGACDPSPCATPTDMVWIPSARVRLGQVGIAEPVNDFYVEGFYIDRYEVSNAKYKVFIDAGGYTTAAYWNPVGWAWRVEKNITTLWSWNDTRFHGGGISGNEQFPVQGVSWWEADAYCRWAGGRLPTEAEWEKAAKGGCEAHGDPDQCDASDTPTYPWGEDINNARANYFESYDPYELDPSGVTTPVGFYDGSCHPDPLHPLWPCYETVDSRSPYGLYDVVGNAYEWCSTKFADYPYNPRDGREAAPTSASEAGRVLRGGSCYSFGGNPFDKLSCAHRTFGSPDNRWFPAGFRCARSG